MPNRYVSVLSSTESLGSDTREFVWTDEAGNTSVSAAHMLQYLQPRLEPVSKAVTVRARTCKDGKLGETITTATYFVNSEQGFPRVSITTDPELLFNSQNGLLVPGGLHWTAAALGAAQSQNIANYMTDASVAVNCEIFSADGTRQSSQRGTMRLSGNASRLEKQKSLLFTDETGQSIKLRAQHNNNVVYYPYLDAFWKNYLSQQQIGAVENSFVDLYIDGEYWGHFNMRERAGVDMIAQHEGWANADDIDLLQWLMKKKCTKIQSFGSLKYFRRENAPADAPERCIDGCPHAETCPYNAVKLYLDDKNNMWFRTTSTGKVDPTDADVEYTLRHTQYGKCVFKCDNDVVDHQVVNMEFADKSTASFTMSCFNYNGRKSNIMGTKGEMFLDFEGDVIRIFHFEGRWWETIHTNGRVDGTLVGGHGGGDPGIVNALYDYMTGAKTADEVSEIGISCENTRLVFAAERSRLNGDVETIVPLD